VRERRRRTNQELASNEDEDAVRGGLGIEGRDLVLDLLEWESL